VHLDRTRQIDLGEPDAGGRIVFAGLATATARAFLVSHLRLVLDVRASPGKQHASGQAKAARGRLLDEPGDKRPATSARRFGRRR
jgi:hypothetical protein